MGRWYDRGLAAAALLALFGCAEQDTVTPTDTLAQVRAGQLFLTCREPCLAGWRSAQPQAAQLDAGGRWLDLATLLRRTGYQDDLSLYYLGRAAEGLGARQAAANYYRQSAHVSATANSCQSMSRQCGGISLPRAALQRAAAIEGELARARPRRPGQAPQEPAALEAPVAESEASAPAPEPTAPALVPAPAPAPVSRPPGPPASEYIEPPPAPR
jgi:hypothetical protein